MDETTGGTAWPWVAGDMARRIRAFAWAATPLGDTDDWPAALRTAAEVMLASTHLASLAVGPERIFLYNDTAARHYGERHPGAFGRPLPQVFVRQFDRVARFYDRVFAGESLHVPAQPLEMTRSGDEEVFDAYLVPVRDADGAVIAALMTGFARSDQHHAEDRLRKSEARLAAELSGTELLRDLGERLVPEQSSRTFYEELLAAAIDITRSDAGTVQVYNAETDSLVLLVTHGFEQAMTDRFRHVEADSLTACGLALRANRRTFVDFDDDPDEACRMHVAAGYRSAQATPLLSRDGTPLGMLNTHWRAAGHRPSERELRFLDLLARQAADLIEARQAREALRASEERQAFLLRLGDAMRDQADAEAVIATASRMLGEQLGASRIVFAEIDDAAGVARIRPGWTAAGAQGSPTELSLADFGGPLLADLRAGKTARFDSVGEPPHARSDQAALAAIGVQAGLSVPLIVAGRFVVNLNVHQHEPRRWTNTETELAELVAERLWAAVERARAQAALRESEARLAAAFESVPAGVAVLDTAGRVVIANSRYLRFLPSYVIPSRDPERGWRWRAWDEQGQAIEPHDFPGARALRGESVVPGQEMLHIDEAGREI